MHAQIHIVIFYLLNSPRPCCSWACRMLGGCTTFTSSHTCLVLDGRATPTLTTLTFDSHTQGGTQGGTRLTHTRGHSMWHAGITSGRPQTGKSARSRTRPPCPRSATHQRATAARRPPPRARQTPHCPERVYIRVSARVGVVGLGAWVGGWVGVCACMHHSVRACEGVCGCSSRVPAAAANRPRTHIGGGVQPAQETHIRASVLTQPPTLRTHLGIPLCKPQSHLPDACPAAMRAAKPCKAARGSVGVIVGVGVGVGTGSCGASRGGRHA